MADPPQRTCFTESGANTADGWWHYERESNEVNVEAKRAEKNDQEKVQKKRTRCRESSQARYKLCSLFTFDSTIVVLELWLICDNCSTWPTRMRTYALAWHGARHRVHA